MGLGLGAPAQSPTSPHAPSRSAGWLPPSQRLGPSRPRRCAHSWLPAWAIMAAARTTGGLSGRLLCLSQVGIRLSCYPFHHSQRGPEPSRTPAPPPVSCSGPNALRGGAVDLQGRTLEVDVGASQALVPSGVIRAWAWGSRGNPEETEFCACTCLLVQAERQC